MPKGTKVTFQTPAAIANMLRPVAAKQQGRKVWSIDLETVWVPFFTASNITGNTAIPREALGAPLRLGKDKDGSIRFRDDGRPVLKVAPELSKAVGDVRQNILAELVAFPNMVYKANPTLYQAEVEKNHKAGEPIIAKANREIAEAKEAALKAMIDGVGETETEGDASTPQGNVETEAPEKEKELVPA